MTQSIEPSFSIWLKELNPFLNMTHRNLLSYNNSNVLSKNMTHKTQRIEPSFHKWLEDLTFVFQICLIEITFFFLKKRWLEELIFWKYQSNYTNFILTQRIELFLKNMTHRNWTFFTWLKELNPFLNMTQRIENFHDFLTQRIEPFLNMTRKCEFFLNVTHRIELFYRLKEMSSFFQNDKDFVEYDSKNRTFVWICPKELNLFWNFTQWIEHSAQKDSKNWTLKDYLNNKTFLWIGELGLFSIWLTELNSFLEHDSQNWTFFFLKNMTHWDWTLLFFLSQRKWLHF